MKKNDVPQDSVSTYAGQRKLFYATDDKGNYLGVQSSGWEVEGEATKEAIREIESDCFRAWQQAQQGISSPLEYHMYNNRMDLPMLAQTVGMFQWRVKRHFKPSVFNTLPDKTLTRYGDALGLELSQLKSIPVEFSTPQ
ncbi:hypothetical protein [Aurantivibrio plasticivorans]